MKIIYSLKKQLLVSCLLLNSVFSFAQCWSQIAGGRLHTVALKTDGTLWAWGGNTYGNLGDGTTTDKSTPIQIGTETNWAKVCAGGYHTLAIKTDGTLWAWGRNDYGQLGDGTIINKSTPIQIGVLSDWSQIESKEGRTLAIKTDGTLWSWGITNFDENTEYRSTPEQVGTDTDWSKISCGFTHIIALKTNGTLWGWGGNGYGQLGDGTTTLKTTPIQIGAANDWSKIATGYMHTVALKTDGTLWAWGPNEWGWLGDGTTIGKTIPTQIGTATNWSQIAASNINTVAIKTDGTVWTWGANYFGQLGNHGDPNGRNVIPRQVGTATNWSQITMGYMHVIALKTDNTLWAWGGNFFGNLGDGTTIDRYAPREISCSALSVDNPAANLDIALIYPNPASTVLNIETRQSQLEKIELYDLQGRLILMKNAKTETNIVLDISNVTSGTYIVKLFTDKGTQNTKIIKN